MYFSHSTTVKGREKSEEISPTDFCGRWCLDKIKGLLKRGPHDDQITAEQIKDFSEIKDRNLSIGSIKA